MIRVGALLAATLVIASSPGHAQTYPHKPITLIVPFAVGGSNDIVGRAIGKKLSEAWGQPVVVDNRAGAGGVIGTSAVATAAPDGYTLLLVSPTFTINPAVKKNLPFDPIRDFSPVAFIARSPLLLTASNKLPVKSAKELLDLAKSRPGEITYASSGPGSINQISAELIALSAGVKLLHVPYKGGAPGLNDLVGGHVDLYVSSLPQVLPLARSGQAKALAVTSARRTALLPDVPTLEEAGISGVDMWSWVLVGHRRSGRDACECRQYAQCGNRQNADLTRTHHVSRERRRRSRNHDAAAIRRHDARGSRALDQGRACGEYFGRLALFAHRRRQQRLRLPGRLDE